MQWHSPELASKLETKDDNVEDRMLCYVYRTSIVVGSAQCILVHCKRGSSQRRALWSAGNEALPQSKALWSAESEAIKTMAKSQIFVPFFYI